MENQNDYFTEYWQGINLDSFYAQKGCVDYITRLSFVSFGEWTTVNVNYAINVQLC